MEAGRKGGDAVGRQIGAHAEKTLVAAVGEVRAGVSVGVDVHQTGNDQALSRTTPCFIRNTVQNLCEDPVLHTEAAQERRLITGEEKGIFIEHGNLQPHTAADWLRPRTDPHGGFFHPGA